MKKIIFSLFTCVFFFGVSAQNKNDIEKYTSQKLQYGFTENKGQINDQHNKANPNVKYLLCLGNGMNVQLKANGFSYDTYKTEVKEKTTDDSFDKTRPNYESEKEITYNFHRVDVELDGANTNPEIIAEEPSADYLNYYNAVTPESGATSVRNYGKITYKDIYPGIDMVFVARTGEDKPVEYTFVVQPGADAGLIKLHYIGANNTRLNNNNIEIDVAHGSFTESIPASWIKETNDKLDITYRALDKDIYCFEIPSYASTQTLIIDPNPNLDWGTYYGGYGNNFGNGISCDADGNVYVTGETQSNILIATSGAHQETYAGKGDAFVVKFNSAGVRQWGTYYGGSDGDSGNGISCDGNGNVFVTGTTCSTTGIATIGVHQQTIAGYLDAFILKFNSAGVLQWGTYYGGSGDDQGKGISCDVGGNVFVIGETKSTTGIATSGAHQETNADSLDAFIVKFNSNGVRQWGTYYGGSAEDRGEGISCDGNGNVYVTGYTGSTTAIATSGAHQEKFAGNGDAFVVKFNSNGVRQWGTYYGGMGSEEGNGISCDGNGNVFVIGDTHSSNFQDWIATSGAHQETYAGKGDAFVVKFNSAGVRQWGTYYGGNDIDFGKGISCDGNGNVFVTGYSLSESLIATSGAHQEIHSGAYHAAFVSRFSTCDFPANAGLISGPTSVCQPQNSVIYSVPIIANASSYVWTLPFGATGTSDTNSISVDYGASATSGYIRVKGINSCGEGVFSTLVINLELPVAAQFIEGPTRVCESQNSLFYYVPLIANATSYVWTLPSGATGTSNTNSIIVNYGASATSGNITVKGTNSCGDGEVSTLDITVDTLPLSLGAILGDTMVCQGDFYVTYSVPKNTNATSYVWTLPSGVTEISATNSIDVDFETSATSSKITVMGTNSCGYGDVSTLDITVNPLPAAAGIISGPTSVCRFQNSVIYSVPIIANATSYVWTLPPGATGTSTTNSITVNYGASAISGNVRVKGINSCGDGGISTLTITVNTTPPTPIITQNESVLHSDALSGNQWYNQNGIILNATSQDYYVTENGDYYVIVTINGCSSDSSNSINIKNAGIELVESNKLIKVSPNPVSNELIIEIEGNTEKLNFEILNTFGQVVFKGNLVEKTTVQTSNFEPGIYLVKLENGKTFEFKKIVKQ